MEHNKIVNKYKDLYLKKSKTTEEEWFLSSKWRAYYPTNNDFSDCNDGWFTYAVNNKNNTFYIGSLFYDSSSTKNTSKAFSFLRKFAKKRNCKKIIFYTARNGKIWERRFKDIKITGWRMEVKL